MKRFGWLIALGILALLLFVLATLPAGIAAGRLEKLGVQANEYSGSIWSGRADGLAWRGAPLGNLEWRLTPLTLLRGLVAGHVLLTRDDGKLETDFSASFGGDLRLAATTFDFPVATLSVLPLGMPKGWQGKAQGRFEEIVVTGGWPTTIRGTLDMDDLVAPPPRSTNVGGFHVVLPHPAPKGVASLPGHLSAQVTDKQGPFSVEGQLSIARDRSFLFEGLVAPRGEVPEAMRHSLEILGPPDAAGRRPFSVSGTL
ncbi:MAG TPA: type II secretion system protein N [Steroidobacteraceae bacterium]